MNCILAGPPNKRLEQTKRGVLLVGAPSRAVFIESRFAAQARCSADQWSEACDMVEEQAPEAIVRAFIQAMNAWEISSWELDRQSRGSSTPSSHWPEIHAAMDAVFARYCTPRERPYGRQASFQRPPEYDPERETIIGTEIQGNRAFVDTERVAALGGGYYRYVLRRVANSWRIDSLKQKQDEHWVRAIL